jgi:hypothetical protein
MTVRRLQEPELVPMHVPVSDRGNLRRKSAARLHRIGKELQKGELGVRRALWPFHAGMIG